MSNKISEKQKIVLELSQHGYKLLDQYVPEAKDLEPGHRAVLAEGFVVDFAYEQSVRLPFGHTMDRWPAHRLQERMQAVNWLAPPSGECIAYYKKRCKTKPAVNLLMEDDVCPT
jgi:hypothetical protein